MDKVCRPGAGTCPQQREAAAGEDETERRPPWPRGPTGGERNEMPCEMIAMAAADEARRRREKGPHLPGLRVWGSFAPYPFRKFYLTNDTSRCLLRFLVRFSDHAARVRCKCNAPFPSKRTAFWSVFSITLLNRNITKIDSGGALKWTPILLFRRRAQKLNYGPPK
jgi:hypothetical protein